MEAKERTAHAACTYGWIYAWDERTGLVGTAERTVAILSTTELNEDSALKKEEIKSTGGIGLSALLLADAVMTLMSDAALLASSRAASTVARSGALIWSDGVVMEGTKFEG